MQLPPIYAQINANTSSTEICTWVFLLYTVSFCKTPKDMSAVNKKRPLITERSHVYGLNLSQFIYGKL